MDQPRPDAFLAPVHALGLLGQLGSYTRAAQQLGISKAAMSQRMADLERALGVALVVRTTRSVRLTEAGQQLVDDTQPAFAAIATALAGVRDRAATPRGLLRVTAPVALARQQLVPRLPAFLRAHPDLRLQLDLSDRLVPLAQEGFDLAIRHCHAPPETHVAWPLCATGAVLVASRAYLRRRGMPKAPQALTGHDALVYLRPGEVATWTLRQGADERTVPVSGPLSTNNSEALREAALGGLGIALLPDFSAQAALARGQLLQVLPDWQAVGNFGGRLFAIRPYSPYVPLGVRALVDFLRAALAEGFGGAAAVGSPVRSRRSAEPEG